MNIHRTRNGGLATSSEPNATPPHPLVVDQDTKLCRPITDADVRIMEAKCHAYDALILSLRESIRMADYHADALRRVYGK